MPADIELLLFTVIDFNSVNLNLQLKKNELGFS